MNKKFVVLFLICVTAFFVLTACGKSTSANIQENSSMGTNVDTQAVEQQISSLEKVNKEFEDIMRIRDELVNELSTMSSDDEYNSLVKADQYVKEMRGYYADLLQLCNDNEDLKDMAFQIKVLDHSCPDPISNNDSVAINNQKTLYQLHLKQISSSFTYLSSYMHYLAGNASKPNPEMYYSEVPEMPKPDTVMNEITYDSEKTDSGVKQYMYLIGSTEEDANMNYNAYIIALGICDGLAVEITSNAVYVMKNGTMVSAMMAGTDPIKGRFMIVSFQE